MVDVTIIAGDNPHSYDDEGFTSASVAAISAIEGLWAAGGSADDIANVVKDGLEGGGAE